MSRKTRREQRMDRDKQRYEDDTEQFIKSSFLGLTEYEMNEVFTYAEFYQTFFKQATMAKLDSDIINYPISFETIKEYNMSKSLMSGPCHMTKVQMNAKTHPTMLCVEAEKKGFESVFLYVRFLKLTLLEEDGSFRVVSKKEQSHIKRWVHMKRNFMMKWDIFIDVATPESSNVWEVPES
ncbi:unnamed protein product [Meganyctiphanes norvegica]|uniref:Uncharacterized protein n=1 Tax=Meganyctiphanes norvegica TaxID=48144 RepID=A0AAV2RDK2_MEGNR